MIPLIDICKWIIELSVIVVTSTIFSFIYGLFIESRELVQISIEFAFVFGAILIFSWVYVYIVESNGLVGKS